MRIFMFFAAALWLAAIPLHGACAHDGHKHGQAPEPPAQASAPPAGVAAPVTAPKAATPVAAEAKPPGAIRMVKNLHPASVHFPIALLLAAALAEILAMARGAPALRQAGGIMAVMGGISAMAAAVLGWVHTGLWFGRDGTMAWHRWLGTLLGVGGAVLAVLALRQERYRHAYRGLLFALSAIVIAQAFLGAEISHGAGHLFR